MKSLFDISSYRFSSLVTKTYSTSFSLGIQLFSPKIRPAIYAIYGFVRYADEIVDTLSEYPQEELLMEFEQDYQKALDRKISLNPILNAFQEIVHRYDLDELVRCFLESMKMDLNRQVYETKAEYEHYIYGSANVIGLMCLKVFLNGDQRQYEQLKAYAIRLGSAFQKVNFLRDVKYDLQVLERSYFPNVNDYQLTEENKYKIIAEIESDFEEAYKGIVKLPVESRLGVYLAYRYYLRLLKKLKSRNCQQLMEHRIRVSNRSKMLILLKSYTRHKLNMI